jgi:hypothetical protein
MIMSKFQNHQDTKGAKEMNDHFPCGVLGGLVIRSFSNLGMVCAR